MNIYADVTKELKTEEFKELDMYLKKTNERHLFLGVLHPVHHFVHHFEQLL